MQVCVPRRPVGALGARPTCEERPLMWTTMSPATDHTQETEGAWLLTEGASTLTGSVRPEAGADAAFDVCFCRATRYVSSYRQLTCATRSWWRQTIIDFE